jgi:hypothetical protein
VVIDLTLPIGVARGRVAHADGAPAVSATVSLAQEHGVGNVVRLYGTADANGVYAISGLVNGPFEVLAVSANGEVSGRRTSTVADIATPVTVDITLEPSGTVSGTARNSAGNPLPLANVALGSDDADVGARYVTTDAQGVFSFARVPVGAFTVQTCDYTVSVACGAATGEVVTDGQAVTVDIATVGFGTVSGTVSEPDGVTPVPNVYVSIAAGSDGPYSSYQTYATTDANGHYGQSDVPAGTVTVSVLDPNFDPTGMSVGTLVSGGAAVIDVRTRTALAPCRQTLVGADALRYDPGCFGELLRGGRTNGQIANPYQNAYILRINGNRAVRSQPARSEINGRQLVYGPFDIGGAEVTRKLFVPDAGGFARYLETVSNPSTLPLTVTVQLVERLRGGLHLLVDPAANANTYAVMLAPASGASSESGPVIYPALANVLGGPSAPTSVSAVRVQQLIGPGFFEWRVTIPAGESVTLMHFAVQRSPDATAGAEAQAQALVNLTDPVALTGMTAEEKARVINFKIQ